MNFRILGPLEVLDDGGGTLKLGRRKERALLAHLVLHANRTVSRDACIEALWPNGPPERADANLDTLIARLRRTLEPERAAGEPPARLVRDNAGYRLVAAHHEVDARRFRQAADRGRTLLDAGEARNAQRHLATALGEWRGPALGEFAYDAFADRAAEQLEELRVAAVEADLGARVTLDEPNAIPELESFVTEHPLREHAWGYLLVALYRNGRQTEALRRADEFRATLADVGLDPSPRVRSVVDAIHSQDPMLENATFTLGVGALSQGGEGSRPSMPRWWQPSDSFVGRSHELDVLRETWFRCRDGAVLAAVIVGEAGIGKSTLAVETAERALAGGGTVLAGRCSATSAVSYHAMSEALGRLVDSMGDAQVEALGDHAPRLARLLPMAEHRLGSPESTASHDEEVDRHLLFEAVAAIFGQQADRAPTLLVLDDLQWADAGTLHMLDHLLRSDRARRLLVIGTVRGEDLDSDSSLRSFVDSWYRSSSAIPLEVSGMGVSEVRELVHAGALFDGDDERSGEDRELADDLHSRSDGNPFFVVEMTRHLYSRPNEADALPETIHALVRSRLGRIAKEHRRVLQIAALEGDRIDLDILSAVSGEPIEVGAAVDEAVSAGLLTARSGTVHFRHDLVRSVLEGESGPAQRAGWHRALGQAYLHRAGDDPGAVVDRVAGHFVAAAVDGDATAAVHYAQIAGDRARAALAYAHAADHYLAGIQAMEQARPVESAGATNLRVSLLEAWQLQGEHRRVTHELATRPSDVFQTASLDQLRRLASVCVHCALTIDKDDVDAFDTGLARLERRFGDDDRAGEQDVALVSLARALMALHRGDAESALTRMDEVLAARSPTWSPELQVLIVDTAIFVLAERRPVTELVRLVEDVHTLVQGQATTRLEQRQVVDVVTRWAAMTTGDVERALELDHRMADHATQLGMPRYLAGASQRRASLHLVRGQVDEAEFQANEAIRYRPDDEFGEGYLAQLAVIRHHQGRVEELVDALSTMTSDQNPAWTVGRAWMLAEVDLVAEARALLDGFVERLDHWDRDISWLGTLGMAVYAADTLQATDVVVPLRAALTPHSGRVALTGLNALIIGPVDLHLGMLGALTGDVEETVQYLNAASGVLKALDAEVLAMRASLAAAEALERASDVSRHAEAVEQARNALASIDRLQMRGSLRERAEQIAH